MSLLARRSAAEFFGTAFLVMTVVGSGVMASRLSPDDAGLQLLQNSLATGAALVALILALQPVSASFNPVVTLVERALGMIDTRTAAGLVAETEAELEALVAAGGLEPLARHLRRPMLYALEPSRMTGDLLEPAR